MGYEHEGSGGRIEKCYIVHRPGDPQFFQCYPDGSTMIILVGYAIVPIEEYEIHIAAAKETATMTGLATL